MGKKWDSDKGGRDKWIAWLTEGMKECLRVLKPGGMALVWCIPRTAHWTATAIEDAGFEIREKFYHIFGSGFPKSLDISAAIDRKIGKEREVIGKSEYAGRASDKGQQYKGWTREDKRDVTIPATPEAQRFSGYGTGLKPSVEEWVLAMKPLDGTFAENAIRHNLAGLNINGSRIGQGGQWKWDKPRGHGWDGYEDAGEGTEYEGNSKGRWPSNLLLSHSPECREIGVKKVKGEKIGHRGKNAIFKSTNKSSKGFDYTDSNGTETVPAYECAAGCPCGHVWATEELTECPECGCRKCEWVCPVKILDLQAGPLKSGDLTGQPRGENTNVYGKAGSTIGNPRYYKGDSGNASRFFKTFSPEARFKYAGKASRTERELGLKHHIPCVKCNGLDTDWHLDEKGQRVKCVRNDHNTVKPLAIMEYLCNLTKCPDGGVVLDPFLGSGTTAIACVKTGRKFIGIDNDSHFIEISKWAIEAAGKRYGQGRLF